MPATIEPPKAPAQAQAEPRKYKYKYKLLHGHHAEADTYLTEKVTHPGGYVEEVTVVRNGQPVVLTRGRMFHQGDTFETDENLKVKFKDFSETPKFQLLSNPLDSMSLEELQRQEKDVQRRIAEAQGQKPFTDINVDNSDDTLDDMSVEELRRFALEQELDIGKARTKEELIKAIKAVK